MTTLEEDTDSRIDRLLDAIELVKLGRKSEAQTLLRGLIQENNDFEDAWLWMSVAVDSMDQSTICLDNVLRVNPDNAFAAGALYRLRETELAMERRRARIRLIRDVSLGMMWSMVLVMLYLALLS